MTAGPKIDDTAAVHVMIKSSCLEVSNLVKKTCKNPIPANIAPKGKNIFNVVTVPRVAAKSFGCSCSHSRSHRHFLKNGNFKINHKKSQTVKKN